jgi:hypothetical protein
LENAKKATPNCWSKSVRNCELIGVVMLDPDKVKNIEMKSLGLKIETLESFLILASQYPFVKVQRIN